MELAKIIEAVENSWCRETSSDSENWSRENPAWGQCAVTAAVLNDYVGGDIVWAEAALPSGRKVSHYFNLLKGNEIDLTREQFPVSTVIPKGVEKKKSFTSTREYVLSFEVTRNRYELLKGSVENYLKEA